MRTRASRRVSIGTIALVASLSACHAPRTRPVLSTEVAVGSTERGAWTRSGTREIRPGDALPQKLRAAAGTSFGLAQWVETFSQRGRSGSTTLAAFGTPGGTVFGSGPAQLDADLGPVDLGYPLLIDLGAGDAPYDDGVATIHAEERKRGGFSDSIIQMMWRERLSPQTSIHTGAALQRFQDLGILDGLSDAEFAWAVVGLQFTF